MMNPILNLIMIPIMELILMKLILLNLILIYVLKYQICLLY